MLDWIQQTLAGPRAQSFVPMPRFGHPDLAESLSAAASSIRGRKRAERRASTLDELNRAVLAAGGAGAVDATDEERAAVAF